MTSELRSLDFGSRLPPRMRLRLGAILRDAGADAESATLAAHRAALARVLAGWKQQGALGIKFYDAYFRSLLFEDVAEPEAARLFARGRSTPLSVPDYRRLQDHVARWRIWRRPTDAT